MKTKFTKRDLIWFLIVANLIIWTVTTVKTRTFYNHYVGLVNSAQAQEKTSVSDSHAVLGDELSDYDWMKKQWTDADAKWEEVWAVIQTESRWQQEAWNCNTNQTLDLGLYQWNLYYHDISPSCAIDLRCSTVKAIELWQEQGWTPWHGARKVGL